MKHYTVEFPVAGTIEFDLDADSPEDAIAKAQRVGWQLTGVEHDEDEIYVALGDVWSLVPKPQRGVQNFPIPAVTVKEVE